MSNTKPYEKLEIHSISEYIHVVDTFNYMLTLERPLQSEHVLWLSEHCRHNWYKVDNFPNKSMSVYMFRFPEDVTAFKLRFGL